jgi:ribonuclease HI
MAATPSIFCDGACSGNGTKRAVGGWAWAYWPGIARGEPTSARAEALATPPIATNQRAELMALLEALRWWAGYAGGGAMVVYTDSMYAINCTSVWGPAWRRKGWTRASGEPLQNLDLIQPLVALWMANGAARGWRLQHVRGHQSGSGPEVWGNNWVDRAAVEAAEGRPTEIFCGGGSRCPIPPSAAAMSPMMLRPVRHSEVSGLLEGGGGDTIDLVTDTVMRREPPAAAVPPTLARMLGPTAKVMQSDIRTWFGGGR